MQLNSYVATFGTIGVQALAFNGGIVGDALSIDDREVRMQIAQFRMFVINTLVSFASQGQYGSLDAAIALASQRGAATVSIAGGGEIYAAALPVADEMILSYIPEDGGGDVFFPRFDAAAWRESSRETRDGVDVVRYVRRTGSIDPV